MKTTPPVKTHIVVKEERKTPASPPMAWGYLKIEKGWNFEMGERGEREEAEEAAPFADVKTCNRPTSHLRPLKMETTQRLMNS